MKFNRYEVIFGEREHVVYCDHIEVRGDNVIFFVGDNIINVYHKPDSVRKIG